jgi:hypothetical protein
MPTEAQLQHLYQQLHRTLDEEGATTMIELLGPYARHEPATKADVDALRLEMRAEMAGLEQRLGQRLTTVFVGTQGVTVAVIGLLLALT